jgi:hypothetical protein
MCRRESTPMASEGVSEGSGTTREGGGEELSRGSLRRMAGLETHLEMVAYGHG